MSAGEVANELLELLELEFDKLDPVGQRIVSNRILERLAGWIPPRRDEPPITPMTTEEAKRFDMERIEFGKYDGYRFSDIDTDYLAWLADSSRELWRKLHAYLRSDLVKNRRESEGEDDG